MGIYRRGRVGGTHCPLCVIQWGERLWGRGAGAVHPSAGGGHAATLVGALCRPLPQLFLFTAAAERHSPALRHVAALLALSAAGSTSPACRDTAIALLLAAHGAGAPPPGRATLRAVSAAALRRTAEAVGAGSPVTDSPSVNTSGVNTPGVNTPGVNTPGVNTPGVDSPGVNTPGVNTPGVNPPGVNTPGVNPPGVNTPGVNTPGVAQTARLLNKHACGVLALWLRHHLPLPRLPCALFVPDTAPPLPGLVRMLRAPLFAAAVLASDRGTLHLAANTLGTDSAGALLGSLPAVLAAVLPLRHSATEEGRHNAAMAIAFVADVLAPSSLAVEAQARHADVIEALVCSAASDSAPIPPRHLLRSVYKALKSEKVVGIPALALALPRLPVQRLYALILGAHAAAVAGSDVAPLELLLSHSLLGDEALRRAAVPHLLQQALLDVIATRGAGSLCDRAARLLVNLHAAMPEEVRDRHQIGDLIRLIVPGPGALDLFCLSVIGPCPALGGRALF
eukprot:scaffold9196_cov110-Isochrysis_galbana.AAC.12